jgi:hypothetical protein
MKNTSISSIILLISNSAAYKLQSFAQIESDPICGTGGCNQYTHPKKPRGYPINYPVPNFGKDDDINTTKESIDIA